MKYQEKIQEKRFLDRVKAKDPEVFAEIYNHYIDQIYRFIYFKVPRREEAEDLTSEVFLKTWQYLFGAQKEVKNLRALLYQIAKNLIVDFYRQRSKVEIIEDEYIIDRVEITHQQSLLSEIDDRSEIINIEKALKKLKDEYKEVIILRYLEQLELPEIAKILNKSKGAVRVLLHRALKVIKDYLK